MTGLLQIAMLCLASTLQEPGFVVTEFGFKKPAPAVAPQSTPPTSSSTTSTPSSTSSPQRETAAGYVLMYTASWCGPCQGFKRTELPKLEAMGIDIRQIDCSRGTPRGSRVSSLPTFVVMDGNDREVARYVGGVSAQTLMNRIPSGTKSTSVSIPAENLPKVVESKPVSKPVKSGSRVLPYAKVTIDGTHYPSESLVRSHLQNGHGVVTDGMSHEEMVSLHDALHGY